MKKKTFPRTRVTALCLTLCMHTMLGTVRHRSPETDHMHLYLWGMYNHLERKPHIAQPALQKIVHDNGSVYAFAGYIDYLFSQHNYMAVLAMAPVIKKNLTHLPHHQLLLAKSFEIVGNVGEADRLTISVYESNKHLPEIAYTAAIAHMRQGNAAQALAIAHEFLDHHQDGHVHFIFHFLCAQLYVGMNNIEKAQTHIKQTVANNPQFEQGWLLFGMIHELQGNLELAMHGYQAFLNLVGHHPGVENQLMMIAHQKKKHDPDLFEYALRLYQSKAYPQALTILNTHIKKKPRHIPAILLKLEILCTIKQREIALQELQKHLNDNAEDPYLRKAALLISKSNTHTKDQPN